MNFLHVLQDAKHFRDVMQDSKYMNHYIPSNRTPQFALCHAQDGQDLKSIEAAAGGATRVLAVFFFGSIVHVEWDMMLEGNLNMTALILCGW